MCLVGVAGKRRAVLDAAARLEEAGFPAVAVPSLGTTMATLVSLAHVTGHARLWSAIQPIYLASPYELAATAAHLHEITGGRFTLGIGVSHPPMMRNMGVQAGAKPLSDMRAFVEGMRAAEPKVGALPPIALATLRNKMLDLALEVAEGAMWANASRRWMPTQLARIPAERRASGFALANMVPVVIDANRAAARTVHRKTLWTYIRLPNYRNYWIEAGYGDEMAAIEAALARKDRDAAVAAMSDAFVDDCTVSGAASEVRERIEDWASLGVEPIVVMSSTSGGQLTAIGELIDAFR